MKAEIVNTFVRSAQGVLQSEVGSPINIGQLSVQTAPYTSQHITTIIGITGDIQGVILLGLSQDAAKTLMSHMVGRTDGNLDELAQSAMAEMTNVIAGTSVTNLSNDGYHCTISPPTVVLGSGTIISTLSLQRLVLPLVTPCGQVEMQLALKINGNPSL
jgi:chemotaxis protein CheX